ncbi:unnamed protein product [marine sediment metagenome]|uniref:Uncharacterized protein n=1 Tax=marine sediment metagenome TaxID=412755 RepID=X1NUZ3_9ZZZZ
MPLLPGSDSASQSLAERRLSSARSASSDAAPPWWLSLWNSRILGSGVMPVNRMEALGDTGRPWGLPAQALMGASKNAEKVVVTQ